MQDVKLNIARKFTTPEVSPYDGIEFIEWTSRITEETGKTVELRTIIAPNFWSQTAVDIVAQKYLRKAGIPRFLKKIPEQGLPKWLYRSEPDESMMKNIIDRYTNEDDVRSLFNRLAGCWTYWGWKGGYFNNDAQAKSFHDELCHMLVMQKGAPNSPQFFNTGIYWAYGINNKPQGHYYYDTLEQKVKPSSSAYERPQVHACFIQSISDNLIEDGGIMDLALRESRVFKFGSGSGTNFSPLRGKGEPLSGGGKSSGLMSFLRLGDSAAGAIKSGGVTRRAAKMVTLDINHPEIIDYIDWKVKEEDKVVSMIAGSRLISKHLTNILNIFRESNNPDIKTNKKLMEAVGDAYNNEVPIGYLNRILALLAQGITDIQWEVFNSDFNGTAYSSVNGQNSNNSVRLSNEFMHLLINDEDYKLINRVNGQEYASVKASYLMDKIALASWICADPGVQFDDTINEWHTCPNSGRIDASNPCSEYMFLNNTACNLASINLVKFQSSEGQFDMESFTHAVRLWTIVLEISVYMAQYPSAEIALLSHKFRTLGLGYANLGALLMRNGVPYDSDKGRSIATLITAVMHGASYETSADLAEAFGAFEGFGQNRDAMLRVIENHRKVLVGEKCIAVEIQPFQVDWSHVEPEHKKYAVQIWNRLISKARKHGLRNAQVTLLAPTGTIGLLMDCDTTGIEPDYALVKHKKLAGGGYMKIVNQSVEHALRTLNYNEKQIKEIVEYIIGTGKIDNCPSINRNSLLKRGLSEPEIDKINNSVPSCFTISSLFSRWILGEETFKRLGVPSNLIHDDNFSLLEFLGFTKEEIHEANMAACGRMCIEGAPHIHDDILPVFDCANKNGVYGKRYISTDGHILMMAATQPFLSGAISKTVNMPSEATIADCRTVYIRGWELGLKAIALFRSDSKLASALNAGNIGEIIFESKPKEVEVSGLARGIRESLPTRRRGYTQRVTIGGITNSFYHTTGENESGDLREVFITGGDKEGTPFRSMANCFAKAVSIGLQYGVPINTMVDAFIGISFAPNGQVTGHPYIKFASSLPDYLMRDIAISYCNRVDLAHCMQDDFEVDEFKVENNEKSSYTGELCGTCGSFRMVKAGTCSCCQDCGSTSGCG